MKKIFTGFLLLGSLSVFSNSFDDRVSISKEFKGEEYACYQNSLDAIQSGITRIKFDASKWCEGLDGYLGWSIDSKTVNVIVHGVVSPLPAGCRGDVTVNATFTCFL